MNRLELSLGRPKKIVFITGTRADFGKLKPLMKSIECNKGYETHVFITGMHMLAKYGSTWEEVKKNGFKNIYKFINQNQSDGMDHILSKTVSGLSDYVREIAPDMLVIHGDRVEALAGAIVGAFNNILVAHIEGGEVSGTLDELIRHSVTKLSHVHFVANDEAKRRLLQLGELYQSIYVIGSPDIDIMSSDSLPTLSEVQNYYDIPFENYGILIFHPVTTELDKIAEQIKIVVDSVIESKKNFLVIYPNNDSGNEHIFREYIRLNSLEKFKIFPSMRFEYFLTALKNAKFIIGNSSAGIREAPYFSVPTIDLGTRQNNRVISDSIIHSKINKDDIKAALKKIEVAKKNQNISEYFGDGKSAMKFYEIIKNVNFWNTSRQKYFVDQ